MTSFRTNIFLAICLCITSNSFSQSCPENIGFENGSFFRWTCYTGNVSLASGVTVSASGPVTDRHTLFMNTLPQEKDPYGQFPVNCPNGSGYSIRLGNSQVQAQAERVSYTFMVPIDKNEYSFIYNYAIVFQNPSHLPQEQPKFTSSVYDETTQQYLSCGAFEFVSSSGLPGFQVSSIDPTVWYKPWAPVTVKLIGCAGKTITIEFTTNDCTRGGHFGYAYLDVNENCTSPITGNVYCNGASFVKLQAPFGFQNYNWYNANFTQLLGQGPTLHLDPIPPIGTKFAVEVMPYPGLGCLDTLYTTIQLSAEGFHFALMDTVRGCAGTPLNLTAPVLTQGSTNNLTFSYFLDSIGLEYLAVPSQVTLPGQYYIKAVNTTGCTETKPVNVLLRDVIFNVTDPPEGCSPNTVDLTAPSITATSDPVLTYTYWKDLTTTVPLPSPNAVSEPGRYYIKATDGMCQRAKPVDVMIWKDDQLKTNPFDNCGSVDLKHPNIVAGSPAIFTYSFWKDMTATIPVTDPKKVTESGVYYVKGTLASGCAFVKPVDIIVHPLPNFTIIDPAAVTAPQRVDITKTMTIDPLFTYSFWMDSLATKTLVSPSLIMNSGRFFIRAVDTFDCVNTKPVNVVVNIPYHPTIKYPNAFSPNKDGLNDRFRLEIGGNITIKTFRIFNRWGQVVFKTNDPFEYWTGEKNGKAEPIGTYYWVMELVNNNNNDFYRKTGSITLVR